MRAQTEEQRGQRACALTARGSISKALKGLAGRAAGGTAEHRKHWTTALIPRAKAEVHTAQRRSELKQHAQSGVEADTRKPAML